MSDTLDFIRRRGQTLGAGLPERDRMNDSSVLRAENRRGIPQLPSVDDFINRTRPYPQLGRGGPGDLFDRIRSNEVSPQGREISSMYLGLMGPSTGLQLNAFAGIVDELMQDGMELDRAKEIAWDHVTEGGTKTPTMPDVTPGDIPIMDEDAPTQFQWNSADEMWEDVVGLRQMGAETARVGASYVDTYLFNAPGMIFDAVGLGNWWNNWSETETKVGQTAQVFGDLHAMIKGPFHYVRGLGKHTPVIRSLYQGMLKKGAPFARPRKFFQRAGQTAWEFGVTNFLMDHTGLAEGDLGGNIASRFRTFKNSMPTAAVFATVGSISPENKVLGQVLRQGIGRLGLSTWDYYATSRMTGQRLSPEGFSEFIKGHFTPEHAYDTLLHWGIDAYFFRHGVSNKELVNRDNDITELLGIKQETLKRYHELWPDIKPLFEGMENAPNTAEEFYDWQMAWYKSIMNSKAHMKRWKDINLTTEGVQFRQMLSDALTKASNLGITDVETLNKMMEKEHQPIERGTKTEFELTVDRLLGTDVGKALFNNLRSLRDKPDEMVKTLNDFLNTFPEDVEGLRREEVIDYIVDIVNKSRQDRKVIEELREDPELDPDIEQEPEPEPTEVDTEPAEEPSSYEGILSLLTPRKNPGTYASRIAKEGENSRYRVIYTSEQLSMDKLRDRETDLYTSEGIDLVAAAAAEEAAINDLPLGLWRMQVENLHQIRQVAGREGVNEVLDLIGDAMANLQVRAIMGKTGNNTFEFVHHLNEGNVYNGGHATAQMAEILINEYLYQRIPDVFGKRFHEAGIELPELAVGFGSAGFSNADVKAYTGKVAEADGYELPRIITEARREMKGNANLNAQVNHASSKERRQEYQRDREERIKIVGQEIDIDLVGEHIRDVVSPEELMWIMTTPVAEVLAKADTSYSRLFRKSNKMREADLKLLRHTSTEAKRAIAKVVGLIEINKYGTEDINQLWDIYKKEFQLSDDVDFVFDTWDNYVERFPRLDFSLNQTVGEFVSPNSSFAQRHNNGRGVLFVSSGRSERPSVLDPKNTIEGEQYEVLDMIATLRHEVEHLRDWMESPENIERIDAQAGSRMKFYLNELLKASPSSLRVIDLIPVMHENHHAKYDFFELDYMLENLDYYPGADRVKLTEHERIARGYDRMKARGETDLTQNPWNRGDANVSFLGMSERLTLEKLNQGKDLKQLEDQFRKMADNDLVENAKVMKKERWDTNHDSKIRASAEIALKELIKRGIDPATMDLYEVPVDQPEVDAIIGETNEIRETGGQSGVAIDGHPKSMAPGTKFTYKGRSVTYMGREAVSVQGKEGETPEEAMDAISSLSAEIKKKIRNGDFDGFEDYIFPDAPVPKNIVDKNGVPIEKSDLYAHNRNKSEDDYVAHQLAEIPRSLFDTLGTEEQRDLTRMFREAYAEMRRVHEDTKKRNKSTSDEGTMDHAFSGEPASKRDETTFLENAKRLINRDIPDVVYPSDKDLNEIFSLVQTPHDVGLTHPSFGRIFQIAEMQTDLGGTIFRGFYERLKWFVDPNVLPDKEARQVNKLLWDEHNANLLVEPEKLAMPVDKGGYGFNERQIKAYTEMRKFFNKDVPLHLAQLAKDLGMEGDVGKFLAWMKDRPAYLPAMRYGTHSLRVLHREDIDWTKSKDKEYHVLKPGKNAQFFSLYENKPGIFRGATIKQRLFGSQTQAVEGIPQIMKQLQPYGRWKANSDVKKLREVYDPENYVYEVRKTKQLPKELYEDVPLIKYESALAQANLPGEIRTAALEAVRKVITGRGFAAHMLPSAGVPGQYRDYRRVSLDYAMKFSTYLSKLRAMPMYSDALAGINASRTPSLYRYATRYTKYFLLPSSPLEMAPLRGFLFDWLISGKLSSAVLNGTANLIFTAPLLGMHIDGKNPVARMMKGRTAILKGMKDAVEHEMGMDNLTHAEKDALEVGMSRADLTAQMMEDVIGVVRGHLRLPGINAWGPREVLRTPFAYTERVINRKATLLTFYRLFRQKGNIHIDAVNQAIEWTKNSHFRYGRHNRPRLGRGLGAPFFVFRSFLIQALQLHKNLMFNKFSDPATGISRLKQWQAFGESTFTMLALGGIATAPFSDELREIAISFFGVDPEELTRRQIQKWVDPRYADMAATWVTRGLPASLPERYAWDMSGPLGLDVVPVELRAKGNKWFELGHVASDLAGAPSVLWQRIGQAAHALDVEKGKIPLPLNDWEMDARYYLMTEYLSPDFIRNAARAWRLNKEGALTSGGKQVYDPTTNRRYRLDEFQMIMKALGFQPRELNKIYDYILTMEALDAKRSRAKSRFVKQYASAIQRNDRQAMAEVRQDVAKWNMEYKDDPSMKIRITRRDVTSRIKSGQKLPKQQIRRARSYRESMKQ